jgi:hypothetical protein
MIKDANDAPVTYLNKGQTYSISITDTAPPPGLEAPARYRTTIHVSFDDEHRRTNPGACWQLWKQRRGTNEAQHRGGSLQAVQFIDIPQARSFGTGEPPTVELETAFIDGISVLWSPPPAGTAECTLAVRFNFLSTDFNQSRGMKGIPLRLCASTEMLGSHSNATSESLKPEIGYCKVKILRDHGAERKLSHDIDHVKRAIGKLKRKIAQVEPGIDEIEARQSMGVLPYSSTTLRPGKIPKSKNVLPTASAMTGNKFLVGKELHLNLKSMQDMFTSTRQHSALDLKGGDLDVHDCHPILLSGNSQTSKTLETIDIVAEKKPNLHTVDIVPDSRQPSPYPSDINATPRGWGDIQNTEIILPHSFPANIQRHRSDDEGHGNLSVLMEAAQIDSCYQPRQVLVVKPSKSLVSTKY